MKARKDVKAYLASIGSKGGQATGSTKVRGDSTYYRALARRSRGRSVCDVCGQRPWPLTLTVCGIETFACSSCANDR